LRKSCLTTFLIFKQQIYYAGFLFPTFFSGILVPGGFGKRGTEGKISAAEWGRKIKKPYLGMVFS